MILIMMRIASGIYQVFDTVSLKDKSFYMIIGLRTLEGTKPRRRSPSGYSF